MSTHGCCANVSKGPSETDGLRTAIPGPRPAASARHHRDIAGWIVSCAGLAVVPKCPICLAAYLAVGSGVAVSVSTAAHLRLLLILLCMTSLLALTVRRVHYFLAARAAARPGHITSTAHARS